MIYYGGNINTNAKLRNAHKILVGKPEGRDNLEDLDVDGRIVLKCILQK
jgi:hypothetical protein